MNTAGSILLWPVRLAAIAGLAIAGVWAFHIAAADHYLKRGTLEEVRRAIAWAPDRADSYIWLSVLLPYDQPAQAESALRQAVALNRSDSRSWIELALRRESIGDLEQAERYLLIAAENDQQYLPRWSLANFYFRNNNLPQFWQWAGKAAERLYGDPTPLFRLCGAVEEDGKLLDRLNLRSPDTRASYLNYLMVRDHADLIGPAVQRVLEGERESDVPMLLVACDRLLEIPRVADAAQIWNRLSQAHRIAYGPVSVSDAAVVNGKFASEITSRAFDWRLPDVAGVSSAREDESGGLRLTFSGRQPENCQPLAQLIPVVGERKYELEVNYSTASIAEGSGLGWRVEFEDVLHASDAVIEIPPAASPATQRFRFDTPPDCHLIRLSLDYRRAPGTTRIEGYTILRSVRLHSLN